jgi:Fe-S cluster assembly protein SufD
MSAVAEQIGSWTGEFTGQRPSPFQKLREAAFARFSELGFPTTHDEEWRFTNVAPIARATFTAAEPLIRVNGRPLGEADSLPKGLTVGRLTEAAEAHLAKYADFDSNAFVALNTAFLGGGLHVQIARGAVIEEPVQIEYVAEGDGLYFAPRALIVAGAQSQCRIVETYRGTGAYFTNAVTEVFAGEGAILDHYKVTVESSSAFHVAALQAQLSRSTNFSSHSISMGGALVRNEAGAVLAEGSEATLNGLYVATGTDHIDNHTVIDHAKPNGASHELYKGILDDRAQAVFNGRIIVRKDAQKTDSKQTNKNLVLSDEAVIDTKPELQIHADDVRCTHGATIGQLDAESLFYLRARGIGKREARSLLIYAFAQDIIDRIQVPALRDGLERKQFEKLHEHAH